MIGLYDTQTTGTVGWRLFQLGTGDKIPVLHALTAESDTFPMPVRLDPLPESFRYLYATLEAEIGRERGEKGVTGTGYILGVTSAVQGEGVSTVALHLARAAAAATFKRVAIVELSLSQPVLAARVGAGDSPLSDAGAVSLLENTDPTVPVLRLASDAELYLLPAGRLPQNPSRSARSPRLADLLAAARTEFDLVIIDMPAVASDNAHPLAAHTNGVAFVVRAGVTPRTTVSHAMERVGRHLVRGVVMNDVHSPVSPDLRRRLLAEA